MTNGEPINYGTVEQGLIQEMARLQELEEEFTDAYDWYSEAEVEWKIAMAEVKTRLRVNGFEDGRKATDDAVETAAVVETKEKFREYGRARGKQEVCKRAMTATEHRLDSLRSLMASHREITG